MRQAPKKPRIQAPAVYLCALRLAVRHGTATSVTTALLLQSEHTNVTFEQAYKRANYVLTRLAKLRYMIRKRIQNVDYYAITKRGCVFLSDADGTPADTYRSTTDVLRPTKAGNHFSRHRLAADFVALFIYRELVKQRGRSFQVMSERYCLQQSHDSITTTFGKRPDGYIQSHDQGGALAIEVDRSRRNANGWNQLMQAIRYKSGHGDLAALHPAYWLFAVETDTKTDITRALRKEFGSGDFAHYAVGDAGSDVVVFYTGRISESSLCKATPAVAAHSAAFILKLPINGRFMEWLPLLESQSRALLDFLRGVFDRDSQFWSWLQNAAEYSENSPYNIQLLHSA